MEINLKYLPSLSQNEIRSIEDILTDERLLKHLWIELLLNPDIVNTISSYVSRPDIQKSLQDALSWYLAFRWLLPENKPLEELYEKREVMPYKIKLRVYRERKRDFIKGLIYAGLC
ncbi:MAG: hypothetical protein N2257_10415 [Thermodesulfovibrionales bacterium]|nr:hypothetical protein [Thermodesulfovibrionales bacterium]